MSRASRSIAGRRASKVGPRSDGTSTSPGRFAPGGIRAADRALRTSVTSARSRSTAASSTGSRRDAQAAVSGQSATISSSGSSAACGLAAQIASVRNGRNGWRSRSRVSSASTRVHQVASRSSAGKPLVGQPDLGQLEAPVAELAPGRLVQLARSRRPARTRPSPRRRSPRWPRSGTAASDRPVRVGPGPALGGRRRPGSMPAGRPSTKRAAFHSLLPKLRAFSSLSRLSLWSLPGVMP